MTIYNRQTEKPGSRITRRASGAITVNRFVKVDGSQATVLGERVIGVSYDGAQDAELIGVTIDGTALVEVGAYGIGKGMLVMTDVNGKAVKATKGKMAAGVALQDALSGQLLEIMIGTEEKVSATFTTTTTTTTATTTTAP